MTPTLILLGMLLTIGVGVLGYVFWPLLRPPAAVRDPSAEIALDVLRGRRDELIASLAHLPQNAPEREAALAEFALQARDELETVAPGAAPNASRPTHFTTTDPARPKSSLKSRLGLAASALALLLAPAILYLLVGMPEAATPGLLTQPAPASVDELVARLQSRLKDRPDDADGWLLLGRSELARENHSAAREALEKAQTLRPKDANILADLADALAQQQGRRLDGPPMELVRQALALDPNQGKALALAGAWEVTQGNTAGAIAHWSRLLTQLPPDSEQARQIDGLVQDLRAGRRPGSGTNEPVASSSAATGPSTDTPGPAALRGQVVLDDALRSRVPTGATLFVVARALDAQDRPSGAPLAVIRTDASQLPLNFTLDDAQAMSPASRLSAQSADTRIVVIARISGSGEAALRSGDLLGTSSPVKAGTQGIRVLIDTSAP